MEPLISVDQKVGGDQRVPVRDRRVRQYFYTALQRKNKIVPLTLKWPVAAAEQKNTQS